VGRPTVSDMAKAQTSYRCSECGWHSPRWVGRCGECQAWSTVEALAPSPVGRPGAARRVAGGLPREPARPIAEIDARAAQAAPSGVSELDRVLGGGLVPGAVMLLAGEPGVGKSTLLLEVAARVARAGSTVLYVTGEESAAQVRLRAGRVGALEPRLLLAAETDLVAVAEHVEAARPALLVVDSVQTVTSADVDGAAGGVTQVREVAAALTRLAKERGVTTILVGHVTKDGSIAGPRTLEHVVDVLHFEGDRHSRLRMVRGVKNRYGPSDEVGCFDLGDEGIVELPDPSGLFLTRGPANVPGQCVTVTVEGRRPLVAEVQALVADTTLASPRRVCSGLDSGHRGGCPRRRPRRRPRRCARRRRRRARRAVARPHDRPGRGRPGRRAAPGHGARAAARRSGPPGLHQRDRARRRRGLRPGGPAGPGGARSRDGRRPRHIDRARTPASRAQPVVSRIAAAASDMAGMQNVRMQLFDGV
jgi:DNA repair protein RadA/Sms